VGRNRERDWLPLFRVCSGRNDSARTLSKTQQRQQLGRVSAGYVRLPNTDGRTTTTTFHIARDVRALNPPELSFSGWPAGPEMNEIFIVPLDSSSPPRHINAIFYNVISSSYFVRAAYFIYRVLHTVSMYCPPPPRSVSIPFENITNGSRKQDMRSLHPVCRRSAWARRAVHSLYPEQN